MILCERCGHPGDHDPSCGECVSAQGKAMAEMLKNIGDPGVCRGCGAQIFWVRHKNGKITPYERSGLNHFAVCPKWKEFKK